MQRIIQFWKSGLTGKLAIGCGGLVGLFFICAMCGVLFGQGTTRQEVPTTTPAPAIAKTETIAIPTATETPVETNTPRPTDTAVPTATILPQPTSVAGINVTRAAIQSVFEKPEIGFKFEEVTDVRGQPRVMGEAKNGLAFIELIGPPQNLRSASIMVGLPSDAPVVLAENTVYMLALLTLAAPDWEEGPDWLSASLATGTEEGGEVETVHGNLRIALILIKEMGIVTLTIEARE